MANTDVFLETLDGSVFFAAVSGSTELQQNDTLTIHNNTNENITVKYIDTVCWSHAAGGTSKTVSSSGFYTLTAKYVGARRGDTIGFQGSTHYTSEAFYVNEGTLPAPTGGYMSLNGPSVTVDWNAVSGASSYELNVSYNNNGYGTTNYAGTGTSSPTGAYWSNLNDGSREYRVRAVAPSGKKGHYAYFVGETMNRIPNAISVSSASNVEPNAYGYSSFYINGMSTGMEVAVGSHGSTQFSLSSGSGYVTGHNDQYALTGIGNGTTVYVRLKASGTLGGSVSKTVFVFKEGVAATGSATRSDLFTVYTRNQLAPLPPPTGLNSTVAKDDIDFMWNSVSGNNGYYLQVKLEGGAYDGSNKINGASAIQITPTRYRYPDRLSDGRRIYKVATINADGVVGNYSNDTLSPDMDRVPTAISGSTKYTNVALNSKHKINWTVSGMTNGFTVNYSSNSPNIRFSTSSSMSGAGTTLNGVTNGQTVYAEVTASSNYDDEWGGWITQTDENGGTSSRELTAKTGANPSFQFSNNPITGSNPGQEHSRIITVAGVSGSAQAYVFGDGYMLINGVSYSGINESVWVSNGEQIDVRLPADPNYQIQGEAGTGLSETTLFIGEYYDTLYCENKTIIPFEPDASGHIAQSAVKAFFNLTSNNLKDYYKGQGDITPSYSGNNKIKPSALGEVSLEDFRGSGKLQ